ncbi:pentapeptide repeat-containing protein [Jannaschia ovalis]|uniref:Pentapeptide repeat-containing protein n=1 Tax=Jannaschia ovalis TaxID=3038773 RepID=A0ABY8LB66_9RHOB|nr:pentapeptide repeat-containing protein [Jannaschia sp. GRR-S6-38]WGH78580.1 pentapeptide repeat-containing protein [Jannaschia sp. GRR-S6-38]
MTFHLLGIPMPNPTLTAIILGLALPVASPAVAQPVAPDGDMRALGHCEACQIANKDYTDDRLTGIDLGAARIESVTFDGAGLGIAVFEGAVLRDVSFAGADLRGASFVDAQLTDVDFAGADLRGAVFEGAVLTRTDLQEGLLCNTQMPRDELDNSDCAGSAAPALPGQSPDAGN